MKKVFVFSILFFSAGLLSAKESLQSLLEGYLKNNLELHTLSSEVQKQMLNSRAAEISNGFTVQLTTGEIEFKTGSDSYFTLKPKASVSVPQADSLNFSISSNITFESDRDKNFTDISLALTADIYSGAMEERRITLLESERSLLTAKRALQDGFISAEKEFYSELKSLYETSSQIISAKKKLYEDKLSFEQVKAQGYSTSSTKYRLSQSEVANDEHRVQVYIHKLEREVRIFASKCGVEYNVPDASDFLPDEIPETEGIDILSFKKSSFKKIESAEWKNFINTLKRKAQKTMTLKASAGYTFDHEIRNEYCDTVDASLSYTWNNTALTAKAGVSFPVDTLSPVYSLGLTFIPHQAVLAGIDRKQDEQDELQEQIAIQSAENDYSTSVTSQQLSLADLLWSKKTNAETYDMYDSLERDMKEYLRRGIVTESEYNSAHVNKENYRIELLKNNIELIIYNSELRLLFTKDDELSAGKGNGSMK